jgi:hypothetical protein
MKRLLFLGLAIILIAPAKSSADGCFVAPKFVWNKHKDINEPTQKAIIVYDAGREDLILQVKYEGPADEFGWLIPVPNLPTVQQGSMKCFYELSQYTQRHFETEWQHSQSKSMTPPAAVLDSLGSHEPPVKVIEIKTVGAYEIAVLSTKDSSALTKWLETNQFYFPTNKTDVIDSYVQKQWYFVAVKINLGKSVAGLSATTSKLASGELNPLQIIFASDHCVFPLKISSVNDHPSEIQVYVLSPEPLLEKTMLEKKLPLIYSNDLVRVRGRARSMKNLRMLNMANQIYAAGGKVNGPSSLPPFSPEEEATFQKISETPEASTYDLLPFAKITKADLPDSSNLIPRLAEKSWWLTKQTWTFKPEEMRDLEFEPAISIFARMLDSSFGYFAAASLCPLVPDAVPALLTALRDKNPAVRVSIAMVLNDPMRSFNDPRLTIAALTLLKDTEPQVRSAGVEILTEYSNWNPTNAALLVPMLRDPDRSVRHELAFALPRFRKNLDQYIPTFQEMLLDQDLNIRISAVEMLERLNVAIPVEDLLPLFSVHDSLSQGLVAQAFYRESVSNDEIIPLLQNPEPAARQVALHVLYRNANKQSVDLALSLLKDSEPSVRTRAAATLRGLTGQHFPDDQPAEWEKWWTANKTSFVVQQHPEELRPQRFRSSAEGADDRPPPRFPPGTLPQ